MANEAEQFDVVALGCGAGTKMAATLLAGQGKRVALVERRYLGGSCPNIACLPTKNLLHSAELVHGAQAASRLGILGSTGAPDMVKVRRRKADMVAELARMYERRFAVDGLDLIWGEGRFLADRTIEVSCATGVRRLAAPTILIDTGSRATIPPIAGLADAEPMTHVEALELNEVPDHLLILGAGYVGLEFAQAYRRLGSEVTVIGRSADLLPGEDRDFVDTLRQALCDEGVRFILSATTEMVSGRSGERVELKLCVDGAPQMIMGSHLLVAAGRTPNTDGIGLAEAGIRQRADGTIAVDERLRTSVDGVYALGDCAGSPNFTHIAYEEGLMLAASLNGETRTTAGRQVAFCLFSDPEYARVGMNEFEARKAGLPYRTVRLAVTAVPRAQTLGAARGHLKALIDDQDLIIGFAALGPGCGELLAPVQLAMAAGLPFHVFRSLIPPHPTMSEALKMLFLQQPV